MSGLRPWQLTIWQSLRGGPMFSLGIHVDLHTPTIDLHLPGWTVQPASRWIGHTDNCDHPMPSTPPRTP